MPKSGKMPVVWKFVFGRYGCVSFLLFTTTENFKPVDLSGKANRFCEYINYASLSECVAFGKIFLLFYALSNFFCFVTASS